MSYRLYRNGNLLNTKLEFSIRFSVKNNREWKQNISKIEKEISQIDDSNADNFDNKRNFFFRK